MNTQRKPSRKRQEGQALIEFALSMVFIVLLFLAFIELVMLIYTYNVLADSAKEGVRYAIVHGTDLDAGHCSGPGTTLTAPPVICTDATGTNVHDVVTKYAGMSLHSPAGMNVTVSYVDSSSAPPNRVRVVVSYTYQPFFGLVPKVPVNAAAEGRIMY
jgi:Flp pilus assembly protein TadG